MMLKLWIVRVFCPLIILTIRPSRVPDQSFMVVTEKNHNPTFLSPSGAGLLGHVITLSVSNYI